MMYHSNPVSIATKEFIRKYYSPDFHPRSAVLVEGVAESVPMVVTSQAGFWLMSVCFYE